MVDWVKLTTRDEEVATLLQRQAVTSNWLDKSAPVRLPKYSSIKIVGTWNDWKEPCEMAWKAFRQCYCFKFQTSSQGWESFQILLDGNWQKCLHPDKCDARPDSDHRLCGPDNQGHRKNWTIDAGASGVWYEARLHLSDDGSIEAVKCIKLNALNIKAAK